MGLGVVTKAMRSRVNGVREEKEGGELSVRGTTGFSCSFSCLSFNKSVM